MIKITKAILPVAGIGTRFLPATKAQPKEMLPIVDKPVIQYLVEEAVESGITDIIFVTGRGKRAIEDHFDFSYELEELLQQKGKDDLFESVRKIANLARFSYVRQNEPRGDGDALLKAAHLIGDEPVAVLFGDDLVYSPGAPALKQLMNVFYKYRNPTVALERISQNDVGRYGIVDSTEISRRTHEIKKIVEKPASEEAPSNLAVVGKYILTPEIFEELRKIQKKDDEELRLADALQNYLSGQVVYGYEFEGIRYDCGSKNGFLEATVAFGMQHPETGVRFKEFLMSLDIRKGGCYEL